ncbi:antifreeze protein [Frigidibacter sp.]|uniref:antifreeze protein n=1 Tax=Frigidibacter sp. TaxID=2586418 RepID=UPI002732669F|nr:antifreeze protein [Frigidibacter sp.]MDP3340244.1 antifreeze protein [Frigidibacter sp.]
MAQRNTSLASFHAGMDFWRIAVEAQAVIAFRMAGMMGLWATKPQEMTRMIEEKPTAMLDAWCAASSAFMAGAAPAGVMRAGMKPIGVKTAANARRLGKLGPRLISG